MTTSIPTIAPAELRERLRGSQRPHLLDVRTPGEFLSVHIDGAHNLPLDELDRHAAEIRRQVVSELVLVCQSGSRSRRAGEILRAQGMANLQFLEGGMSAWVAERFDAVRGPARISLERQVRMLAGTLIASGTALAAFVDPAFAIVPFFIGCGLVFAGVTDKCGMAFLLGKLPYNRPAACDVPAAIRALASGH